MVYTLHLLGHIITFRNYTLAPLIIRNWNLILYFFLGIFLVAVLVFTKKKPMGKINVLSVVYTTQLKGLAIIIIIVSHFGNHLLQLPDNADFTKNFGAAGVEIFLILSGFGVTMSYLQKGLAKRWLIDKYLRIWMPFFLVTLLWVLLDHLLLPVTHSLTYTLLSLAGIFTQNTWEAFDFNTWFVSYILIQYVFFFVVFSIQRFTLPMKILLVCICNAVLLELSRVYLVNTTFGGLSGFVFGYSIYFPIGILLAMNASKITKLLGTIPKSFLLGGSGLFLIFALIEGQFLQGSDAWATIALVSFFYLFVFSGYYSRFLVFMGTISYELFLIHGPFMYRYDFLFFRWHFYLSIPVYLSVIIVLAYLIHILVPRLIQLITQSIQMLRNEQSWLRRNIYGIELGI